MGSLTALLVLASMMPVFTGDLPKASYTKVFHQFDYDFAMFFYDFDDEPGMVISSWASTQVMNSFCNISDDFNQAD